MDSLVVGFGPYYTFERHIPGLIGGMGPAGLRPVGPPSGIYWSYDEESGITKVAAAVEFAGGTPRVLPDGIEVLELPEATAVWVDHFGPYDMIDEAHAAIEEYMRERETGPQLLVVDEYLTGPYSERDSTLWHTRISYVFPR